MNQALSVQRSDRPRRALVAACLVLGLADLVFIDAVALPRALGREPLFRLRGGRPAVAAASSGASSEEGHPPPNLPPPADGRGEGAGPLGREAPAVSGSLGREAPLGSGLLPRARAGEVGRGALAREDSPQAAPTLALTIHFATGRAALTPRARAAVDELMARADAHPGWTFAVHGHADARGDAALNQRLSAERAQAVAARLAAAGLSSSRLQTTSFGSARPVAEGDQPDTLRRNRRVEILIVRGEP
jgi:outer membrane protein OmpA-like peptidoglycan-associated protein